MKWTEFSEGIRYCRIQETSIKIDLLQFVKKEFLPNEGLIFIPACLNFFITENFIKSCFSQNSLGS